MLFKLKDGSIVVGKLKFDFHPMLDDPFSDDFKGYYPVLKTSDGVELIEDIAAWQYIGEWNF